MKSSIRRIAGTIALLLVIVVCGWIEKAAVAAVGPVALLMVYRLWVPEPESVGNSERTVEQERIDC